MAVEVNPNNSSSIIIVKSARIMHLKMDLRYHVRMELILKNTHLILKNKIDQTKLI